MLSGPGVSSNWHAFNDPARLATLPAPAFLYRRQLLYVFAPTEEQLFYSPVSPDNSVALRTATEKDKLLIALPPTSELPWLEPSRIPAGACIIHDPDLALFDRTANGVRSDTGEPRHDWGQGASSPSTLAYAGSDGLNRRQANQVADVEIAATTRNATVAVQSLDAISEANGIMISLGARSTPTGCNQSPFHSEPVLGQINIERERDFYKHDGGVQQEREIPALRALPLQDRAWIGAQHLLDVDEEIRRD